MPREIVYQAKVGLEGTTPMLHHKVANIGVKDQTDSETDYSNEWRQTVHSNGKVILPAYVIEATMIVASRNQKIGKHFMPKMVTSGTSIQEFEVPILYEGKTFTVDDIAEREWLFSCAAKIGKNTILRTRAAIPIGWYVEFTLDVTRKLLTEKILRDLFDRAGYECGFLDQRPSAPKKPGKFGQFNLAKFEVV